MFSFGFKVIIFFIPCSSSIGSIINNTRCISGILGNRCLGRVEILVALVPGSANGDKSEGDGEDTESPTMKEKELMLDLEEGVLTSVSVVFASVVSLFFFLDQLIALLQ